MSELYQNLSHSRWDCKYHVVFVPKRRRKVLFGPVRRHLGEIFLWPGRRSEDVRFSVEIPDGSPDHCLTLQATRAADLGCLRSASSAARRPGKARYPSMRRNCFSATTSPEPTQRSI